MEMRNVIKVIISFSRSLCMTSFTTSTHEIFSFSFFSNHVTQHSSHTCWNFWEWERERKLMEFIFNIADMIMTMIIQLFDVCNRKNTMEWLIRGKKNLTKNLIISKSVFNKNKRKFNLNFQDIQLICN